MEINFFKYQGTGNDFIILDNRDNKYSELTEQQINKLCQRRFGIGADGLMMLIEKAGYDFEMKYYNADGKEGSLCGNGSRCIIMFANEMGIAKNKYFFLAADGPHEAEIDEDGTVSLKMADIKKIEKRRGDYIVDTGSPHYVKLVDNVMETDVIKKGKEIRYNNEFEKEGINVNFVEHHADDDRIIVRTYERGVEDETYSCGTGVTASALVCYHNEKGFNEVHVKTKGGSLSVEYDRIDEDHFENIWLCGPAKKVYEGSINI